MDDFYFDGLMEQADAEAHADKPKSLSDLVDAYQTARDEKDRLDAELKEANANLLRLKEHLVEAMLEDETDSVGRNGRKYSLVSKTKYSKRADRQEELYERLESVGLGDIIQRTINANTLNAAMNQMADGDPENIDPMIRECLNVYEFTDISVRKL